MEHTVFISHADEDKKKAKGLRDALRNRGIIAWEASQDLQGGQDYIEKIHQAAASCQVLILLVSRHANTSRYVQAEVQAAWEERENAMPGAVILPVLLEQGVKPGKSLQLFLFRRHFVDAWEGPFLSHLDSICDRTQALLAEEGEASPFNPALPRPELGSYREALGAAGFFRYLVPIAWWVLCGALPLISILLEFRHEGFFLAQISPHFFVYPVFVGFFIPYCLVGPAHFFLKRKRIDVKMLAIFLLFTSYVTYSDLSSGDPLPWDFREASNLDVMDQKGGTDGGVSTRIIRRGATAAGFANVGRRVPLMQEARFLLNECPDLRWTGDSGSDVDRMDCQGRRRRLRAALVDWREGTNRRSATFYIYGISLFVQVFTLGLSVVCLTLLFADRRKVWEPYLYGLMAIVFFTYFLWLPFRIVALHEKVNLYLDLNFLTEAPTVLLFLVCYALTLNLTYKRVRSPLIHVLLSVVGVALVYVAIFYPRVLLHVIGRSSDPLTYPIITIVVLLFLFPLIVEPAP